MSTPADTLPTSRHIAAAASARRTASRESDTERPQILIVDDDEEVRLALHDLVRSVGLDSVCFGSTRELLEANFHDRPGCLILDVRMPGLSGLELQDKLISLGLKFRMIFITAYANPKDRERALEAGAVAYLTKPVDDRALMGALQEAENCP